MSHSMKTNAKRNRAGEQKKKMTEINFQTTATKNGRCERKSKINSTIIFKYLTADDENAEINLKPLMITNLLCDALHQVGPAQVNGIHK